MDRKIMDLKMTVVDEGETTAADIDLDFSGSHNMLAHCLAHLFRCLGIPHSAIFTACLMALELLEEAKREESET